MREEDQLVSTARKAARWYEDNLAGLDTLIYCTDGFDFMIRWAREQFPHLTGLSYMGAGNNPLPALKFYDALLQQKKIKYSRLRYNARTNSYAWLKNKVLLRAINIFEATTVYELSSGIFCLGVGQCEYCLGLFEDEEASTEFRSVWRPLSVFAGNIENMGPRIKVFRTHTIERVSTVQRIS